MDPVVGILDIGLGNVASISNAVYVQGVDTLKLKVSEHLDDCTHLILPGVGHFDYGVRCLKQSGFYDALPEFINSGRPVMGICLGMQLLCEASDEAPSVKGIEFFSGRFHHFSETVRSPHMGWNEVNWTIDHPINNQVKNARDFYFVHSFFLESEENCLSTTNYEKEFVSSVAHKNVIGLQFHPEKSQSNGLRLIENFCWWDGKC